MNDFPVIGIDNNPISPKYGTLYLVWCNLGTGTDLSDIFFSKSLNQGTSWSSPVRVNNDATTRDQWLPWLTVDQNGTVSIVFYDSRSDVNNPWTEVWLAQTMDAGTTFTNSKISGRYQFRPVPVSVAATGYMGDYIGISSSPSKYYACWMSPKTADDDDYNLSVYRGNWKQEAMPTATTLVNNNTNPQLTWTKSSMVANAGFNIYRKMGTGSFGKIASVGANVTSFIDEAITMGGNGTTMVQYMIKAVDLVGTESDASPIVTIYIDTWMQKNGSASSEDTNPTKISLSNFPNPFNPTTNIKLTLSEKSIINLSVYDVTGKLISTVFAGEKEIGSY